MMPQLFRNSTVALLTLLLAGSMWFYVRRVLIPHQQADALEYDHPRGNLSDLYPRWLGARELLLHGRDPYSSDITREIQTGYYGRVLDSSRAGDPQDQQAFAYPVYVVFLLAPLVYLPFTLVRTSLYGVLILVTVASVVIWLRALRWNPSNAKVAALLLLIVGSLPLTQGIELQQLTLPVAAMLATCALLLVNGNLGFAGILLAFATIKPQLVLPLAAWLILWSVSEWRRRKAFVLGFSATLGILFAVGEWVLPGWPKEFLRAVVAYRQYTHAASLLDSLTNAKWGPVLAAVFVLTTASVCWRLRHESEQSPRFVFVFALVLAVTLLAIPTVSTYNQVLLLPAVFILIRHARHLWSRTRLARIVWILAATSILWPWAAALGLTIASFILPAARVQQAWALPFYTSMAIPFAVIGLLIQYAFQILPSNRPSRVPAELL
jgi:Glycosyltransferase family 87